MKSEAEVTSTVVSDNHLQVKPGVKIRRGKGQKGVINLSKMLETKKGEDE